MGLDSREVTPELTRVVVQLSAEIRSFSRTEVTVERVLGHKVSDSTIRRLTKQVGKELENLEQLDERNDGKEVVTPEVAVVSCDGGRIRSRQPGQGRGVRLSGENGWRETKNASFEKMTTNENHIENEDPCICLPTSFRTATKVANISEKPVPNVDGPIESANEIPREKLDRVKYEGPRRLLRTAVSSMASSDKFGPQMKREAKRRGFFNATKRAFLGDGLNWNWSIWEKYFPTFIPILDFIHAIQYIFCAAMAMSSSDTEGWSTYVRLSRCVGKTGRCRNR